MMNITELLKHYGNVKPGYYSGLKKEFKNQSNKRRAVYCDKTTFKTRDMRKLRRAVTLIKEEPTIMSIAEQLEFEQFKEEKAATNRLRAMGIH